MYMILTVTTVSLTVNRFSGTWLQVLYGHNFCEHLWVLSFPFRSLPSLFPLNSLLPPLHLSCLVLYSYLLPQPQLRGLEWSSAEPGTQMTLGAFWAVNVLLIRAILVQFTRQLIST